MTREEIEAMAKLEGMPADAFTGAGDEPDEPAAEPATADPKPRIDPKAYAIARRELESGSAVYVAAAESGLDEATVRQIKAQLRAEAEAFAAQESNPVKSYGGLALGIRSNRDKERVGL